MKTYKLYLFLILFLFIPSSLVFAEGNSQVNLTGVEVNGTSSQYQEAVEWDVTVVDYVASQQYGYTEEESRAGNIITGIFALLAGAFLTFAPKAAWYLEIGWKLQDAEPSETAIFMNIFIGIICMIVGVFMFFT